MSCRISDERLPIVLLPGMDGTGEFLERLTEILSLHRPAQVISYPSTQALGYDALTAFVGKQLPEAQFALLAESFSGPIGIELAANCPQQIGGLILASSFARSPLPAILAPAARILDPRWMPRKAMDAMLLGAYGTKALRTSLHSVVAAIPRDVLRQRAEDVLRVDKRNQLRAVTCPILCLHGRFDRLVRKRYAEEIAAIQSRTIVEMLDAPHMLLETHTAEAAEVINGFCDQLFQSPANSHGQ